MVLAPPPSHSTGATDENFHWMSPEEEWDTFDEQVRELLDLSGREFLTRLEAGEYNAALRDPDNRDLNYLAMLARIVR